MTLKLYRVFIRILSFEMTNDQCGSEIPSVDENLVRNTTYANVNGTYDLSGNMGY